MDLATHGRSVSYEDLKLLGLGKAVDEYARITHHRSRSSSRLAERVPGSTTASEAGAAPAEDSGRNTGEAPAGPRSGPAISRMCVCVRGTCALLLLPPMPRVLFEKQAWAMTVALAVPLLVHWFLSQCSVSRFLVSCAAIVAMANVSTCFCCDESFLEREAGELETLRRMYPELRMTDRRTDVAGSTMEELYHAEDRVAFRREQEMIARVERFVARYGLPDKVVSILDAYRWISRLAGEMHLERRHRRVGSLEEAIQAVDVIERHLGGWDDNIPGRNRMEFK